MDTNAENAVFQLEKGLIKGKEHYQGCFTLIGPRRSKSYVLKTFENRFENVSGLSIQIISNLEATLAYTTKSETRIAGPWYCGSFEIHDETYENMDLRPWQQQSYQLTLDIKNKTHPEYKAFQDRRIIWIYDPIGGSGKSKFIKWLCIGQRLLNVEKLPISSVTQLISATIAMVNNAKTKNKKIDMFVIDDTRTKGKDTNFDDMFENMEQIKNGHLVSTMYGKPAKAIFDRPIIMFFTNTEPREYAKNLSAERLYPMEIKNNQLIATHISGTPLANIQIAQEVQKIIADRAACNNSIKF
jgi:hypothetical protein